MLQIQRRTRTAAIRPGANSEFLNEPLVNEKLRISLTQFAGADGFAALLRRALALASAAVPALRGATVSADGHLEGLGQLATQPGSVANAAAVAITAQSPSLLKRLGKLNALWSTR